jgi:hypothetical protein
MCGVLVTGGGWRGGGRGGGVLQGVFGVSGQIGPTHQTGGKGWRVFAAVNMRVECGKWPQTHGACPAYTR